MNRILKYNSILIKYIILFSIITILTIIIYKLYINSIKEKEKFSQLSLEKQVTLYDDYRNYIEGKDYLTSRFKKSRKIPYVVNSNCFTKHYLKCKDNYFPYAIADPLICQDKTYDECVNDNL